MFHAAEHVFTHCQRRLSAKRPATSSSTKSKPTGLHIRQPSLSHSVSSAASSPTLSTHSDASSHSSVSSPASATSSRHRHDEVVDFDPLFMHPTYTAPGATTTTTTMPPTQVLSTSAPSTMSHAPARLANRRFIALFADDEDEPRISQEEEDEWRFLIDRFELDDEDGSKPTKQGLDLPLPTESPTPLADTGHDRTTADKSSQLDGSDYFLIQKRPVLPRSHWSASTIQTALDMTPTPQLELASTATVTFITRNPSQLQLSSSLPSSRRTAEEEDDDDAPPRQSSESEREIRPHTTYYQNFSYKRSTVPPKRPPLKAVDSVENFMKRGGWKRRGIVFQQDAAYQRATATTGADDGLF